MADFYGPAELFPLMNFSSSTTVAIVGAGFSGTLVAVHLLRRAASPLRILLIERRPPVGRGVAYGTLSNEHLLNVPAGKMSAFPDDPGHFLRWLRQHAGEPDVPPDPASDAFLPRALYGRYIGSLLDEARGRTAEEIELVQIGGEVIDLEETPGGGGRLRLADGRALDAELIVLALGNLPGSYPIPRPLPIYHSRRYVHVPWQGDALAGLAPDDDVLLVGQGLTATDLIVELARRGHRGTVHALSRNGQRPQVHQPTGAWPSFLEREPAPQSMRALVRRVREDVRAAAEQGVDWRAVIDALRPHTQTLWQSLAWDERARFLRHVRPFWEIHRHRVPPEVSALIARMLADGRLKFHAGRLQVLEANQEGVEVLFRRRGKIQHIALNVARVINCTGPRTDYSKYQHPLYIHLLARGLIDHDPLALGIAARPTGEVLRYRGEPVGWLFTLGAPLKGMLWETTAVRELRAQAEALANRLLRLRVGTPVCR
jgi:uncharacterized NAD(P)/FAD-binding protein YdhS